MTAAPQPRELAPPRGIVRAPAPDGLLKGNRLLPVTLAPYVHHFWSLRWSLRTPFTAEVLQYPSAQITVVRAGGRRHTDITGVHRGRFSRSLAGDGQTFGITFRAAMFQPLLGASMASLTDRVVPLHEVLASNAWTRAIDDEPDVDAKIAIAEAALAALLPPLDPALVRMRDLVERMGSDRSIQRVEDVCELSGLDARGLQRAFRTYVGVSPKWVLQRYRLHEAAAQLASEEAPPLAALAASLGYADQAHFCRDFKRVIGETPLSFVAMSRGARTGTVFSNSVSCRRELTGASRRGQRLPSVPER